MERDHRFYAVERGCGVWLSQVWLRGVGRRVGGWAVGWREAGGDMRACGARGAEGERARSTPLSRPPVRLPKPPSMVRISSDNILCDERKPFGASFFSGVYIKILRINPTASRNNAKNLSENLHIS